MRFRFINRTSKNILIIWQSFSHVFRTWERSRQVVPSFIVCINNELEDGRLFLIVTVVHGSRDVEEIHT